MRPYFLKNIVTIFTASILIAAVIIISKGYTGVDKKSTEICESCHDDKDLVSEKDGKKTPLYVNSEKYKKSVHSIAECEDCHENYNPDEIPHTKVKQNVNCITCHKEAKNIEASVHGKVNCYDCHTKHDVVPAKEFAKDQTKNCMSCHKTQSIQHYSSSIHAKNNIGCESCHAGGHNTKKIPREEVDNLCGKCHGKHEKDFGNSIHETVFKNGNKSAPTCVDCHGSHQIIKNKVSVESEACMKCHLDGTKFPGNDKGSAKFVQQYKTSIHAAVVKEGKLEAAGCTDCHGNHMIQKGSDPRSTISRENITSTCGKCHKETVDKFNHSKHGQELSKGNNKAPTCIECHGEHDMKSALISDDKSKLWLTDKCLSCHKDAKLPHKDKEGNQEVTQDFRQSVHYQALEKGNYNAPTCSNCHGAHEMEKTDVNTSKLNPKNVAQTCGQSNCHVNQYTQYKGSAHDKSVQDNKAADAPTCNTCHGNHIILATDNEKNRLSTSKGIVEVCSDCHSNSLLTDKYNIKTKRVETYDESIHGIYVSFGDIRAANCSSCHSNHNIRGEKDPQSSIHPDNITQTCGQVGCHKNVTAQFVKGKIHLDAKSKDAGVIYYISMFFKYFTIAVLCSLFLYMFLDFITRLRERRMRK